MSTNKKYYYLKFKENYFDQDHVKVIESMSNGYEYSLIILKLYLKSLKWEGQLKVNDRIPYSREKIELLAGVLGHKPETVMHAINLAKDLGIIEILTTGEIFMSDIQNFIGHSSTEAERKKAYRKRLKSSSRKEITRRDKSGTFLDNRPPEIELEKDIELDVYTKLLNHWNDKNIINHSVDIFKKHLTKKLKDIIKIYPLEAIYKSIDNYSIVVRDDKYFFSYKWSLWDFLNRGLDKFLDNADPLTNFLKDKEKKEVKPQSENKIVYKDHNYEPDSILM